MVASAVIDCEVSLFGHVSCKGMKRGEIAL